LKKEQIELKTTSSALTMVLLVAPCTAPAAQKFKWLRRATLAAACAASAADAVTTYQGKLAGVQEDNPLLRAPNGTAAMGRVIGLKAALCGLSMWSQERGRHDTLYTIVNTGAAVGFGVITKHNTDILGKK
jgi:hypothetical protein